LECARWTEGAKQDLQLLLAEVQDPLITAVMVCVAQGYFVKGTINDTNRAIPSLDQPAWERTT
jgi:hypothetical protein